jgi:branched-subunit amino acid ABC-type transport system permease component
MLGGWVNQIVQGILLGGLYAMFAMGLSLSVGIMRFVNIAHGDLIVLVSFLILTLTTALGLAPLAAALITLPVAFVGGYVLQRLLLQRVLGKGVLPIILVTFGRARLRGSSGRALCHDLLDRLRGGGACARLDLASYAFAHRAGADRHAR